MTNDETRQTHLQTFINQTTKTTTKQPKKKCFIYIVKPYLQQLETLQYIEFFLTMVSLGNVFHSFPHLDFNFQNTTSILSPTNAPYQQVQFKYFNYLFTGWENVGKWYKQKSFFWYIYIIMFKTLLADTPADGPV